MFIELILFLLHSDTRTLLIGHGLKLLLLNVELKLLCLVFKFMIDFHVLMNKFERFE